MNRNDGRLPSQLRVVGATDLERRLLEASARERPPVELTERMQKALGISLAAGAAATAAGAAKAQAAAAGAATPAVAWPAISIGVLALAVTGAVVGVRSTAGHHAAARPAQAIAISSPPSPLIAPPAPATPPAPAEVEHRAAAAPAHHHRAPAATPADLRAEIALVDAARSAVAGGASERALALLGRYDTTYPRGTFRPEAAALRIEALAHLGRTAQARALAQKFIAAHADSPLADRVARVTGLPAR
ncbi:MAG TPA: hypothetical protein VKZ18_17255 [Polyangia bacterium]|nr:hypothetical protein [Polyangia bacterium]